MALVKFDVRKLIKMYHYRDVYCLGEYIAGKMTTFLNVRNA